MKIKKIKKQHVVSKMFAIAVVMMMGVAFTACLSNEEPKPGSDAEYVDLGLPSGTKWGACNLGATKPEEYGDYYAWGETEGKTSFSWGNYTWMQKGKANWKYITKYTFDDGKTQCIWYDDDKKFIGDGKTTLEPKDDAATAKLGSRWRMPTPDDFRELIDKCNWEWAELNGVKGYKVTGTNGNFIFLPAAGHNDGSKVEGKEDGGFFWSNSLSSDDSSHADNLKFSSTKAPTIIHKGREIGISVRAVRK